MHIHTICLVEHATNGSGILCGMVGCCTGVLQCPLKEENVWLFIQPAHARTKCTPILFCYSHRQQVAIHALQDGPFMYTTRRMSACMRSPCILLSMLCHSPCAWCCTCMAWHMVLRCVRIRSPCIQLYAL